MDDTKKFIGREGIQLFLKSVGGELAPKLVANMLEPISDEDLAEKCNMRVADVRMVLNKLHNNGIIDYNRSKDKDSGWYYYGWFLRPDKLFEAYVEHKKRDLETIEERLENNEMYSVYICRKCEQTYDFDRAAELLYHCPLCESILDRSITDEDLKRMSKISATIRKEIEEIGRFSSLLNKKYKSTKVL